MNFFIQKSKYKQYLKNAKKTVFKSVHQNAFTLIELLVVVAIFAVIMSVALWNQKSLSSNVLISNLGYEIALAIRETQAYGIGARAQSGATSAQAFQGGFGIYANMNNPQQLIVFSDVNNNKLYDGLNEIFATYQFKNQNGNKIVALCVEKNGNLPCSADEPNSYTEASVMFKRPNPEAFFWAKSQQNGANTENEGPKIGPLYIIVNTPARDNCRAVIIENTGQVRVESAISTVPACSNN